MGYIGQPNHSDVQEAIDEIASCCQSAGKPIGIFGATPQAVDPYIAEGYRLITIGIDTMTMATAARAAIERVREST